MYKNKLMTRTNKINEWIKNAEFTLANEVTSGGYFRFWTIIDKSWKRNPSDSKSPAAFEAN